MELIDFSKDVYWISDVGLVRDENQDKCYAAQTPNGFLFVVCDGMGGHAGGGQASAIAVNHIIDFFSKKYYHSVHEALKDALVFANLQIVAEAEQQPDLKGMGTTACVVLLRDDKAWFAHIGDSRIYLYCHKKQQLHRLTKDHSFVQGLIDQGVITDDQAENHPNKNRLLRSLGSKNEIQPEVCEIPVFPANGDIFLICSDGLSGMVSDEILQHILTQKGSLQEKGDNMLTFAKQSGGTDNITLQLIQISNSPHMQSIFESKNPPRTKKNKPGKKRSVKRLALIAAAALLVVATALVIFLFDTKTKHNETTDKPQVENETKTDTVVVQTKQKAYEKIAQELEFKFLDEREGKKIYVKKSVIGVIIEGMVVDKDDSFYVGKILIPKEGGVLPIEVEHYDKNGNKSNKKK